MPRTSKQVFISMLGPAVYSLSIGPPFFNHANGDKFISSFYDQIKITCGKRRCKSHRIMIARHRILSRMWSNHMTEFIFEMHGRGINERLPWVETWVKARDMKMTRVIAFSIWNSIWIEGSWSWLTCWIKHWILKRSNKYKIFKVERGIKVRFWQN